MTTVFDNFAKFIKCIDHQVIKTRAWECPYDPYENTIEIEFIVINITGSHSLSWSSRVWSITNWWT